MRFLVADDSAAMRRTVISSLKRIGYRDLLEAENEADALAKFDGSIGFVIIGWNMPNSTGAEFARAVRAHHRGATTPILMVTTRSVHEDILAAIDAGVNNYIITPFTPQVLKEKIEITLSVAASAHPR